MESKTLLNPIYLKLACIFGQIEQGYSQHDFNGRELVNPNRPASNPLPFVNKTIFVLLNTIFGKH